MRLALLGVDDEMLAVAAGVQGSAHDEIVMLDALAARSAEAAKVARKAKLVADWEQFLDSDSVDAVLVAADQPAQRIDQLRKLIQVGMPVLVSHPISPSMLDCYELDMIRRDTKSSSCRTCRRGGIRRLPKSNRCLANTAKRKSSRRNWARSIN